MWRSLEGENRLVTSLGNLNISSKSEDIRADVYKPPVNSLWDHIEAPTRDSDPQYRAQRALEEQERAIIENLEREERERQLREAHQHNEDYIDPWKVHNLKPRRVNNSNANSTFREEESKKYKTKDGKIVEERTTTRHESKMESKVKVIPITWKGKRDDVDIKKAQGSEAGSADTNNKLKSWKSMEQIKVLSLAERITEQVSKDAEWSPPVVHSSWRFFDLETEKQRMQRYDEEQEKLRQVTGSSDLQAAVATHVNSSQCPPVNSLSKEIGDKNPKH